MSVTEPAESPFDQAAQQAVELGNQILADDPSADPWEIASGLLAGAVQFWLFSRQPCDDPFCEACAEIANAERRLRLLLEEVRELAESSEYYESARDAGTGTH